MTPNLADLPDVLCNQSVRAPSCTCRYALSGRVLVLARYLVIGVAYLRVGSGHVGTGKSVSGAAVGG